MRQFHCNANCDILINMIILYVLSDFSSVESEYCIEEEFYIKLALVSISCDSFIKPKKAATLFFKKSSSFQFWI